MELSEARLPCTVTVDDVVIPATLVIPVQGRMEPHVEGDDHAVVTLTADVALARVELGQ